MGAVTFQLQFILAGLAALKLFPQVSIAHALFKICTYSKFITNSRLVLKISFTGKIEVTYSFELRTIFCLRSTRKTSMRIKLNIDNWFRNVV